MKKIFISVLCFISTQFYAQVSTQNSPQSRDVVIDSLLRYVNKSQLKTGLLYDRVVNNANLLEFNNPTNKTTSSYWHYIQALSEVHRSSYDPNNKMQYEIVEDMGHKKDNVLNISFINTEMDYVDYGTKEAPNLTFTNGFFYNIPNKNPFKQRQITVVAALAETITNKDIKIRLNTNMMYQDDSNPIKNLTAIINGTEIKLVSNFENLKTETNYTFNGNEKEIVFNSS